MSVEPTTESLSQLRRDWRVAQIRLSKHELKSDAQINLELLEKARGFPAWRGIVGMGFSWVLPQLPDFMENPDPIGRAILVGFGAIILSVSLWWLFKDAGLWTRWWMARKDLARGKYSSRRLTEMAGVLGEGTLSPVQKDSEAWLKTGEWSELDRQLRTAWEKWTKSPCPVRSHDQRVLEKAIVALNRLREARERDQQGG